MSDALRDFEQLGPSDIDAAEQAHIELHRDHEERIDSLEGDATDFRARLDAFEGPPGAAPPDLATVADLHRAIREHSAHGNPLIQRVFDEATLLFGSLAGRLRILEQRLAHPLIVGAFPDHAPAPVIDVEFPDPEVDGAEIAHHRATILRLEQAVSDGILRERAAEARNEFAIWALDNVARTFVSPRFSRLVSPAAIPLMRFARAAWIALTLKGYGESPATGYPAWDAQLVGMAAKAGVELVLKPEASPQ